MIACKVFVPNLTALKFATSIPPQRILRYTCVEHNGQEASTGIQIQGTNCFFFIIWNKALEKLTKVKKVNKSIRKLTKVKKIRKAIEYRTKNLHRRGGGAKAHRALPCAVYTLPIIFWRTRKPFTTERSSIFA